MIPTALSATPGRVLAHRGGSIPSRPSWAATPTPPRRLDVVPAIEESFPAQPGHPGAGHPAGSWNKRPLRGRAASAILRQEERCRARRALCRGRISPGNITIRPMEPEGWNAVSEIYSEGIATEHATFQTTCPPCGVGRLSSKVPRHSGRRQAGQLGRTAAVGRWCYRGVAEVASTSARVPGRGLGSRPADDPQTNRKKRATGYYTPPFCRTTPPASASTRSAASGWWGGGSASPGTVMAAGWTPTT